MKLASLRDLYVDELKDLYDAENQIVKALPKVVLAASSVLLKGALQDHLGQSHLHVQRLERILEDLGEPPRKLTAKKCKAMKGILEEGEDCLMADASPSVRDAALIAMAQRVEHYEIAGYGCVRTYAETLGFDEAAQLLQQTLREEEVADRKLTELALGMINAEAAAEAA